MKKFVILLALTVCSPLPTGAQSITGVTRIHNPKGLSREMRIVGQGFEPAWSALLVRFDSTSTSQWTPQSPPGESVGSMLVPQGKILIVSSLRVRIAPATLLAIPFPNPAVTIQNPSSSPVTHNASFRVDSNSLVSAFEGVTELTGWLVDETPPGCRSLRVDGRIDVMSSIQVQLLASALSPWTPKSLNGGSYSSITIPPGKELVVDYSSGNELFVSDTVATYPSFFPQQFVVREGCTLASTSTSTFGTFIRGELIDVPPVVSAGAGLAMYSVCSRMQGVAMPEEIVNFSLVVGGAGAWSPAVSNGSRVGSFTVPVGSILVIEFIRSIVGGYTVQAVLGSETTTFTTFISPGRAAYQEGTTLTLLGGGLEEAAFFGYLMDKP